MRIVVRLIAILFIVAALLVLGTDLAGTGGDGSLRPLGALWYALHSGSLNLTQAVIERYIWEPLWDPFLVGLLQWPAAPIIGGLGVLLIALSFLPLRARGDGRSDENEPETDGNAHSRG